MNPALLQHSYPIDYPSNADTKYLEQDRSYTNPAALTTNDFLLSRKSQNGSTSAPLGQNLTLPTNTSLDYNPHHLIQDSPYHPSSQLLLSPPSSVNGSSSTSVHSISSPFVYSNGSKLLSSNASSTEQYSAASASYPSSAWGDSTMTDYNSRLRAAALPPTLSPPLTYGHSNGISGQYFNAPTRVLEQYGNSYSSGRPYHGPDLTHTYMNHKLRGPTFNSQIIPTPYNSTPYNSNCTYSPMPPQTSGRPEGPPFEDTKIVLPLIAGRNQDLVPEISANIQKGFFQVEGKWTCYRRNYFTVSCAFHFKNSLPEGPVYLQRQSQLEPIQQYALSISAKTANLSNQESESRTLVQHTPKRDKATESVPGRHLVQPAPLQGLQNDGTLPTNPLYAGTQHISPGMLGSFDTFTPHTHHTIPTSYTFERIQFQRATANNGKRRAQQQYFHVVVELSVNVGRANGEENWVVVATRQSHPMVVRGRSPGHYKDNVRRDGQTNMDPDRSNGAGSDGASGPFSMPPLMGHHSSSMDWTPGHREHGHNYGGSYSYGPQSDGSPSSKSSSTTLGDTPSGDDIHYVQNMTLKERVNRDYERNVLSPVSEFDLPVISSRKVGVEDGGADCNQQFHGISSMVDNFSPPPPPHEYSSLSSARSLCA